MSADVSILVVTYNCADWITRCLDALPPALAGRAAEVVVIDNASEDDSAARVAAHPMTTRLERNDGNVGFAAAVNQAAALSSAEWLLLLNPDTEARPGSLANLLQFGERNRANGVYGGRTIRTDGRLEPSSCWALPSLWSTFCFAVGLSTAFAGSSWFDPEAMGNWQRDSVREVGMITGCLLLVDRRIWRELRGLDERYFVYGEDADFAARARARGYRPIITPSAEVVHEVGVSSSSGGKMALLLAGKITYVRRQFRPWQRAPAVTLLRAGVAGRALGARLTGRGQKWRQAWERREQWWDGFPIR
jgi:N-acetylglucosaminyl-diphospho-decaprenol L-rhamnosyltransferase